MSFPLRTNAWILVPQGWPVLREVQSTAMKFVFHHIRPIGDCGLATMSGPFKNEVDSLAQKQVSMITAIRGDFFVCYTLVGVSATTTTRLLSPADYVRYAQLKQAKVWHLAWGNLFHGDFEVYNGPNPIDIR